MERPTPHNRLRTLFLSDLHLGALGCKADLILAFLRDHPAETYVLAGDILDLWQPLLPHWTARDQAVVDHLRAEAAAGARLIVLRGNHDPEPDAAPAGQQIASGGVMERIIHTAADERRYLVLHGDQVDARWLRAHVFTRLGSRIDHLLRRLDRGLKGWRRRSAPEARSLIEALLSGVNRIAYARRQHERRLVALARMAGVDGVICGHFHLPALHQDHGLIYGNCGDWVDSFTALAETPDGDLRLLAAVAERAPKTAEQFGLAGQA